MGKNISSAYAYPLMLKSQLSSLVHKSLTLVLMLMLVSLVRTRLKGSMETDQRAQEVMV